MIYYCAISPSRHQILFEQRDTALYHSSLPLTRESTLTTTPVRGMGTGYTHRDSELRPGYTMRLISTQLNC